MFRVALGNMDLLYAHQRTVVWRLTQCPEQDQYTVVPYAKRGWPYFETMCSHLIKPAFHVLQLCFSAPDEPPPTAEASYVDCHSAGTLDRLKDRGDDREPPLLPDDFKKGLATRAFTNNADVDSVLALQKRVVCAVLEGTSTLEFNDLRSVPAFTRMCAMCNFAHACQFASACLTATGGVTPTP